MSGGWTLHWLEAEGDLAPWRPRIVHEVEAARDAIGRAVPPPLPWTTPFTEAERAAVLDRAAPLLHGPRCDHPAWFFADRRRGLPVRAGYRLGSLLVGAHLSAHPLASLSGLAGAPGHGILDDAWPRLRP